MGRKRSEKRIAAQIGVFALAQGRKRVETLEFGIDMAWVAHHESACRQPFEESRKMRGEIRMETKRIGAGKSRIGGDPKLCGPGAEFAAQPVDQQALRVGEA